MNSSLFLLLGSYSPVLFMNIRYLFTKKKNKTKLVSDKDLSSSTFLEISGNPKFSLLLLVLCADQSQICVV